jgi:hypothetical protein
MEHGALKAHTIVRAMQDGLEQMGFAVNAIRARTKLKSDLPIAHCVRLENTRLRGGEPAQTRVLLVWRAHFELKRAGITPGFVHGAQLARTHRPRERAFACSVLSVHIQRGLQRGGRRSPPVLHVLRASTP